MSLIRDKRDTIPIGVGIPENANFGDYISDLFRLKKEADRESSERPTIAASNAGGGSTNSGGTVANEILPSVIQGAATVVGALFGLKASKDASEAQADAAKAALEQADKALSVYEKNAGIAADDITKSSEQAFNTLKTGLELTTDRLKKGQTDSAKILQDSADETLNTIKSGYGYNRKDLIDASTTAQSTLRTGYDIARNDIINAYGIQEGVINDAAVARSKYINAARESAATSISQGFSAGIGAVESARDLVNNVLQQTTNDAKEQLKLARSGALAAQERGLKNIRSDFAPFLKAGQVSAQELERLVNDPNAQKEFITNNPFFKALADDAEERLLSNQAAKGRVGSGSTQAALQTELLKLGNQLLDTSINQRLNTANLGLNAANSIMSAETSVANAISQIEQETGRSLSDLSTNLGVNQGNNIRDSAKSIATLQSQQGLALADNATAAGNSLSGIEGDRAESLAQVGENGIDRLTNLTSNAVTNAATIQDRLGVNLSTLGQNAVSNYTGVQNTLGTNLTNLNTATAGQIADATQTAAGQGATIQNNAGVNRANVLTGQAAGTAEILTSKGNTLVDAGNAKAAGIVTGNSLVTGTLENLADIYAKTLENRRVANAP